MTGAQLVEELGATTGVSAEHERFAIVVAQAAPRAVLSVPPKRAVELRFPGSKPHRF